MIPATGRTSLGTVLSVVLAVALVGGCRESNPTGVPADDGPFGSPSFSGTSLVCQAIDFDDGLSHGDVVTSVGALGITFNVSVLDPGSTSTGDAVIYDTNTKRGNDPDLEASGRCADCAGLNNVLILQEAPGTQGADDSDTGGTIRLAPASGGPFVVQEFKALDQETEQGESITLKADGATVAVTSGLGDGTVETVDVNPDASFSSALEFVLTGSGAIDDIIVCEQSDAGEGCTPGFWKTKPHQDDWIPTGYSQSQLYDDVFGVSNLVDGELTLLDAVSLIGNSYNSFVRHSVAALLNAAHPDIAYGLTEAEVISKVQAAHSSGDFDSAKQEFEELNEQFCPID